MNTSQHPAAARTALTILADHLLETGDTADPARLLTAAELACRPHGLPEDDAPAITAAASFWVALATGYAPAGPGQDDTVDRNLDALPEDTRRQAAALRRAERLLGGWLAYHNPAEHLIEAVTPTDAIDATACAPTS